ncbi:MAG: beta-ketoacyl synthase N-terminal-like domain-containing protein [Cyanobacteria bacterium P01_G01_bin.38]
MDSSNRNSLKGEMATLVDLLSWRSQSQPDRSIYTFLEPGLASGEAATVSLATQDLANQAKAIGAQLQAFKVVGERVLLLLPPGLDYIAAFFGCLYAGAIAVPVYPPRPNRSLLRLQAIVSNAQPSIMLTNRRLLAALKARESALLDSKNLTWLAVDDIETDLANQWQSPPISGESLALLQYTSGSTAAPKGVMVTHHNLVHNLGLISQHFETSPRSRGVIWLPPYHDMGLIGGILQPLYAGFEIALMSPVMFLQQPIRWLQAITQFRADISGGPNFAYELCLNRIAPAARADLDLSTWEIAFSGAEPVRAETLDRFATAFESCGFRREAFYPCYGMAEATLFITGGEKTALPMCQTVSKAALQRQQVVCVETPAGQTSTLVSCGQAPSRQPIVIADPETCRRCDDNQVGEIWVGGPSVAQGYWNQPEKTQAVFQARLAETLTGPFLRTGDLGFLQKDELFITGRLKDLIIIRGRNHYPQDIELTVTQAHPALRPSCGAAFSVETDSQERLVVVQEVERRHLRDLNVLEITQAVRQAIAVNHDLQVYAILLLKTGSIPKTSSGKIQRHACQQGFQANTLNVVGDWLENPRHKTEWIQLKTDMETLAQQVAPAKQVRLTNSLPTHPSLTSPSLTDRASPPHAEAAAKPDTTLLSASRIEAWLVTRIASYLKVEPTEIEPQEPFSSHGLDSATAVSLSGELETWLARPLSPTLIYDYPTIARLARHLAEGELSSEPHAESASPKRSLEHEPVAIIGLGCRFPGGESPEAFWELLRSGQAAIREAPIDRGTTGTPSVSAEDPSSAQRTQWGGFLTAIDQFDAAFFEIAPREAEKIDPQQRWLLEVAWQALEHAGKSPNQLSGTQTGVFVGISSNDYAQQIVAEPAQVDAYVGTGNALSIAANRLSYKLNLQGPSLAVDTACSSGLVAVHLACQSLRQGECDLALVGGVNAVLSPELTQAFSQAQMMAADGRCKTFDAAADGYVRGEGCGVVILKRLSEAQNDCDRILAVIRGSAVNQDGRSNGLTAPNGPAQQAVIRQALARANVAPAEIQYVEAHGTGTPLGDPIEVEALQTVLAQGRSPQTPCYLGSVKTNLGHLEAAAGMAGLIKTVLALQHQEIPPHLNLSRLNPYITLDQTPFEIATETQPWATEAPFRLAGVSAFGFGGTNAHVILEGAELPGANPESKGSLPAQPGSERPWQLLTLSAKTQLALRDLAQRYQDYLLQAGQATLADICFTANTGRAHFPHRLAIATKSKSQLQHQLTQFLANQPCAGVLHQAKPSGAPPKIAFLFTGQGAQFVQMGRQLYETHPGFRRTLERCDEILRDQLDTSLLTVLYPLAGEASAQIDQTRYTQPALFALEYALAELWRSWGIIPDIVMGHSIGEYVAAQRAGVFSLEDGLRLIAARGRLMQALPQDGAMVAVASDEGQVAQLIEPDAAEVAIAAVNGPGNVVISGQRQRVGAIAARLNDLGIKTKPLQVSHAFHSPLMVPMLDEFRQVASEITFAPPQTPLVSTVTGKLAPAEIATLDYWVNHVCQPVQFAAAMATLGQRGCHGFLEIGPKPVLLGMGQACLPEAEQGQWLPSLRPGQADWSGLLQSLGKLYGAGAAIDWRGVDQGYVRQRVSLPTYPFQRQRYWFTSHTEHPGQSSSSAARVSPQSQVNPNGSHKSAVARNGSGQSRTDGHPLLGRPLMAAAHRPGEHLWWVELDSQRLPYLGEHRLWGSAVLFLGAYVEMALAAAKAALGTSDNYRLSDLQLHTPLFLSEHTPCSVQVVLTEQPDRPSTFQVYAQATRSQETCADWVLHASAHVHHA